jgi:hypothetical protein
MRRNLPLRWPKADPEHQHKEVKALKDNRLDFKIFVFRAVRGTLDAHPAAEALPCCA